MHASQEEDWRGLRPEDGSAHFTHGASLLHLHTSGQMRETYGFGTCRSIPSNFYKISPPFSSSGNTTQRGALLPFVRRERLKRLLRGDAAARRGGKNLGPTARWAFVIKRVKRAVRQSAVSHPVQHHSLLNSSCHPVSSAPPRVGQVREITAKIYPSNLWEVREFKFLTSRILTDVRFPRAATVGFWFFFFL